MSGYVSPALRRLVADRAGSICEYCRIHRTDTYWGGHVDHVIAEKHGGPTTADNLAYACASCNRSKGSDIATLDRDTGRLVALYHPRVDRWAEHFEVVGPYIHGRTVVGRATVILLRMNGPEQVEPREALIVAGRYPARLPTMG